MQRQYVESSSIRSIGYEGGTLEVEFNNGGVYHYLRVPPRIHTALMSASSIGAYVNKQIKKFYRCVRIK